MKVIKEYIKYILWGKAIGMNTYCKNVIDMACTRRLTMYY